MSVLFDILIMSASAFFGAILGAICGSCLLNNFATRPARVMSLYKGKELDCVSGFNDQSSYIVTGTPTVGYFRKIQEAAVTHWEKSVISYSEILGWLAAGARGPDGKRTIDKKSSKNPEGTASRLVGHVFEDIGLKENP